MHIKLITPAKAGSQSGNRATAERWAHFLRANGHHISIEVEYQGGFADMMIALHAWRSAKSIEQFRLSFPQKPIILTLTGTDIYQFQYTQKEIVYASMDYADALIGLHSQVSRDIPERYRNKLYQVLQSSKLSTSIHPDNAPIFQQYFNQNNSFNICVIGHLRQEKDSLRAAFAVRNLPESSRIRVLQAGKAHNKKWAEMAEDENRNNSHFYWLDEISHTQIQILMQQSQLMVISSLMEGGANVISEACVAQLPVIASDISGNKGLLGNDYPAYFPAGDTLALQRLLLQTEQNPGFLSQLKKHCSALASRFRPECESASLNTVVDAVLSSF